MTTLPAHMSMVSPKNITDEVLAYWIRERAFLKRVGLIGFCFGVAVYVALFCFKDTLPLWFDILLFVVGVGLIAFYPVWVFGKRETIGYGLDRFENAVRKEIRNQLEISAPIDIDSEYKRVVRFDYTSQPYLMIVETTIFTGTPDTYNHSQKYLMSFEDDVALNDDLAPQVEVIFTAVESQDEPFLPADETSATRRGSWTPEEAAVVKNLRIVRDRLRKTASYPVKFHQMYASLRDAYNSYQQVAADADEAQQDALDDILRKLAVQVEELVKGCSDYNTERMSTLSAYLDELSAHTLLGKRA